MFGTAQDHDNFKAFLSVFFAGHGTVPNAGSVSAEKGLQLNSSLDDNTEDEIMVVATPEQTPFEMKDSQKSTFSITGITPDAGAEITSRNSVRPWIGDIESASRARTLGEPTRPGYLDEDVTVLPRQLRPWPLKQPSRYGAKDDSR